MQYPFILVIIIIALLGGGYFVGRKTNNDIQEVNIPEDISDNSGAGAATSNGNDFDFKGETLDLSNQGLKKAPSYIFDRTNIESLDLSSNQLEGALQAEIRHLSNLKVLDLSDNKFTGVPAEVGQLKNLEVLDLSNNLLTGLPYELGNLSKLKLLDISGNKYSEADLNVIRKSLPSFTIVKTN